MIGVTSQARAKRLIDLFEILGAFVTFGACARVPDARVPSVPSAPVSHMIPIGPAVALEIVDWGGRGAPLVFLAGLGNTAHVFDTFAPQFTDHFHLVGITRRGFGASASAPPPDNLDTLVADVAAALDSLRLEKVVLVGHSIAGEEMTRFAERYGARCAGLVYLDAAYDRSALTHSPRSSQPHQLRGSASRIRPPLQVFAPSTYARWACRNPNPTFEQPNDSTPRTTTWAQ